MYQNTNPPKVGFSLGGPGLTCLVNQVVLTNTSVTGIVPGTFPAILPVIGYVWEGPSPQIPLQVSTTYIGGTSGTYTLTGKDLNNSCTATATRSLDDLRDYPILNTPNLPKQSILDCGVGATASLSPIITSPTNALTYSWTAPAGASVNCQLCPTSTVIANASGVYTITVTNSTNSCVKSTTMSIINGTLTGSFAVDKTQGFAPLTVNIVNNSSSSNSNSNITTYWSYGNGSRQTTTATAISPEVTYNLPGTYTITAFVFKGGCSDTVRQVITVDVPSKLTIPNVFTPNGDKVNDILFLGADNLSEITMTIFDRWGHLVYELTSKTGNIAWDGKSQIGTDCAEGVYYYVLTATGKDGNAFDEKGTITLLR